MIKAHADCPNCECWEAEPGDKIHMYLNGRLLPANVVPVVGPGDEVSVVVSRLDPEFPSLSQENPR